MEAWPRTLPNRAQGTEHYLLAGGGLQNCLIALLVLDRRPDARVTVIERGDRLGGNHTWSFHASDLPAGCERAVGPAVHRSWDTYDVAFPGLRRTVPSAFRTIVSHELDALLQRRMSDAPGAELLLGTEIDSVGPDHVVLSDGRTIDGDVVVDGRGPPGPPPDRGSGYQKFVGLELQLERPGPYSRPMLMDACVPQIDGFRFLYVLPFAPDRVLVEDTRFSDTSHLDHDALRSEVLEYAADRGLEIADVVRTESGVLPMPWSSDHDWSTELPLRGGYAGGFLHPATGFSFPVAARVARHVVDAGGAPLDGWEEFVRRHRHQYRYAEFLNRLAFTAYEPADRYHVFERFYRLGPPLIERFYRLDMTWRDRARLLVGRPPRGLSVGRFVEHLRAPADGTTAAPTRTDVQEVGR